MVTKHSMEMAQLKTEGSATLVTRNALGWMFALVIAVGSNSVVAHSVFAFQAPEKQEKPVGNGQAVQTVTREGILVQVKLPVTGEVSTRLKQVMTRHLESVAPTDDPKTRPVMVIEFDTSNSRNGRGSEFEACLALARFLTSTQMHRIETVAYIPGPDGIVADAEIDSKLKSELLGHPILIALACKHLVMHVDAKIGRAGIDEEFVDPLMRAAYEDIAGRTLTMPKELAIAMVDPASSLSRIELADGKYILADQDKLKQLEVEGKVIDSDTLTESGSLPLFSSGQLLNYQLIRQRTTDRSDISRKFGLRRDSLEGDPTLGKKWSGLQVQLDRAVDQKTVSWIINALGQKWTDESNLVIVYLDSQESDVYEAIRLARHLASYNSNEVRTIAYVPQEAKGALGLIALACDHLVMGPDAILGGGSVELKKAQVDELLGTVRELAEEKGRDWSVFAAMLQAELTVNRYRHKDSGQVRLLCPEEHAALVDFESWQEVGDLSFEEGVNAETAEQYYLARYIVEDYQELKTLYQLSEDPEILEPTLTDRWIESLAGFLASPMVAFWLLFGAMFFISSEMSQPGLGIPGFIGSLFLLLFFWSQFLDGNADWLEILLFAAGVICVLMEIFVIPGMGIFGFGGLLMIVISIVLASQTFIIPSNSEEFKQLPYSLGMVAGAGGGFATALFVFRRFLPHMPVLKRMMLLPPGNDEDGPDNLDEREAVVNFSHILGKRGQTLTQLMPAGKARFGDEVVDVITDGRMIEKGKWISVEKVSGNVVRVSAVDDSST